jgi:2-polyprenyl-3-methyl-5-hydroxy-6-metoxy-1,4-benzoquinol methylase
MKECGICESPTHKLGSIEGYVQGYFYEIIQCTSCNTKQAIGDTRNLTNLYNSIYKAPEKIPGYNRYKQIAIDILKQDNPLKWISNQEESYHACAEIITNETSKNSSDLIIEIGCGQGYLTYAFNKMGYNCIGIDISETAISIAKKTFGEFYYCGNLSDFIKTHKQKPKFVICTELIEHLMNPVEFIKDTINHLAPNGKIIATTPHQQKNGNSIWDTDLPPVHLWYFNKNGLSSISKKIESPITYFDFSNYYQSNTKHRKVFALNQSTQKPILKSDLSITEKNLNYYFDKHINQIAKFFRNKLKKKKVIQFNNELITNENSEFIAAIFHKN